MLKELDTLREIIQEGDVFQCRLDRAKCTPQAALASANPQL